MICLTNIAMMQRGRRYCPTCSRRCPTLEWFQEWYGWHTTCLRCGDQWQNGELLPRPFCPRWRERNIREALRRWREWSQKGDRDELSNDTANGAAETA